jgi:DNA-binding NarL/FixJ family response regulator
VKEALRREVIRVGIMNFVARSFHVERSLEAVKAAATRKGDSYLRFEIAEEAARK